MLALSCSFHVPCASKGVRRFQRVLWDRNCLLKSHNFSDLPYIITGSWLVQSISLDARRRTNRRFCPGGDLFHGFHIVCVGLWSLKNSYLMSAWRFYQPSISAEVKNAWSYTSAVKSPVQNQCSYTLLTAQLEVCKQTA
jgi:hypothetical protein